jgi:alkylation response protein AidB-like acyl-CoA dehydrogenase
VLALCNADVPIDLADGRFLQTALADPAGIPLCGRFSEHTLLWNAGYADLATGRLYEGHVNALQLIARYGTDAQRAAAVADTAGARLFGVWNTQATDGVGLASFDGDTVVLSGRKTFCSGAGRVTRALVTAAHADGTSQMIVVPMDRVAAGIDRAFWQPMGMEASDSFAVDFNGVRVERTACIGAPGDYEASPWFTGGASRFLAVQAGGIARLRDELAGFLLRRGMTGDAIQLARLGEISVALESARLWVDACARAWAGFDARPDDAARAALLTTVDGGRSAVENAALQVCERVERAAGARGLLEPEPFGALIRDLRMYLRQPAPDAALLRVAQAALDRSRAI